MKKIFSTFVLVFLFLFALVACANRETEVTTTEHVHSFGQWSQLTPASCTEDGLEERTCACGERETQAISALNHNYSSDWTVDTQPDCTNPGSKSHHCLNDGCDSKIDVTPIAALDHAYPDEWNIVNPATETQEGLKEKVCTRCGHRITETIPVIVKEEVDAEGALEVVSAKIGIGGYEWGPAADMIMFEVDGTVKPADINADMFSSSTASVVDAFVCDENGIKVNTPSQYFAVKIAARANQRNPFTYANSVNNWTANGRIAMQASLKSGSILKVDEGENIVKYASFTYSEQMPIANRVVPSTATFDKRTFTDEEITLTYGSWGTQAMKEDEGQNPLIIWLHGAGEGGTDIDIALLGNDVTNLTEEKVQAHFANGAYVLACQTPTMWMNNGTGAYTQDGYSMFTETLFKLIKHYCEEENTDVDLDRIYIGGCSNGGYMTVNMMIQHGAYFAAAYPVCEAYTDSWITNDQINVLKEYNIWFTHSADDTTVRPANYTVATYLRLVQAGAQNVYFSYFESVKGTDQPGNSYMGHYSWIYVLQDKCERVQNPAAATSSDIKASNANGGGTYNVMIDDEAQTIFGWMAAQKKGEKHGSAVLDETIPAESQGGGNGGAISTLTGEKIRVEAEDGELGIVSSSNSVQVETNANASNGEGVGYFQQAGDSVTLTFNVTAAKQNAYIRFGVASASINYSTFAIEDMSLDAFKAAYTITLNGDALTPDEGSLTGNTSFNFWNVQEIGARGNLQAGPNTIVITANGAGGCNWDYVDIYYGEVTVTPAQGGGSQGGGSQGGGQQQTGGDTLEPLTGAKQRLEVEEGELDPQAESNYVRTETNANASNGEGVGYFQQAGDSVTLTFTATAAKDNADIRFGVASASGSYPNISAMTLEQFNSCYTITLNGRTITATEGSLPGNSSANYWNVHELAAKGNVQVGTNTIVITANGGGGCNWDYIDVFE